VGVTVGYFFSFRVEFRCCGLKDRITLRDKGAEAAARKVTRNREKGPKERRSLTSRFNEESMNIIGEPG
jgi:hypothetical protein